CDCHQPGVGCGDCRLVCQRCQEGRLSFRREISLSIDGAQQSDDRTPVCQGREYGRPPRERPKYVRQVRHSQLAGYMPSRVCVDDYSLIRRRLLAGYECSCQTVEAYSVSKAVRHACSTDPGGGILFIAECHIGTQGLRAIDSTLGERLDGRLDRVADRDTCRCLSKRGRLSLLREPLANVLEDERDQTAAAQLQGRGRAFDVQLGTVRSVEDDWYAIDFPSPSTVKVGQ